LLAEKLQDFLAIVQVELLLPDNLICLVTLSGNQDNIAPSCKIEPFSNSLSPVRLTMYPGPDDNSTQDLVDDGIRIF